MNGNRKINKAKERMNEIMKQIKSERKKRCLTYKEKKLVRKEKKKEASASKNCC